MLVYFCLKRNRLLYVFRTSSLLSRSHCFKYSWFTNLNSWIIQAPILFIFLFCVYLTSTLASLASHLTSSWSGRGFRCVKFQDSNFINIRGDYNICLFGLWTIRSCQENNSPSIECLGQKLGAQVIHVCDRVRRGFTFLTQLFRKKIIKPQYLYALSSIVVCNQSITSRTVVWFVELTTIWGYTAYPQTYVILTTFWEHTYRHTSTASSPLLM